MVNNMVGASYYANNIVKTGELKKGDRFYKFVKSTNRIQNEAYFTVIGKNQHGLICEKDSSVKNVANRNKRITIKKEKYNTMEVIKLD